MLSIGQFAGMTGLSVKALHHYDDKGVLVPQEVDANSGYRRYGETQVRAGVMIRALRDAGVGLAEAGAAVNGGDADAVLVAHRDRVLAARSREDEASVAAGQVLAALAAPVEVFERSCPPQPYLGWGIPVASDDADSMTDDDVNRRFAEIFAALGRAGVSPSGQFWTSMRAGDEGIEIVGCIPTSDRVDRIAGGLGAELPARTELVARWTGDARSLPAGALHPAVVALLEALADRELNLADSELRQTVLIDGQGNAHAVDFAITVPG